MTYLNVTNIKFSESTAKPNKPFSLEVKFDCLKDVKGNIEWKCIYIANSDDTEKDQILDSLHMEALEYGTMMFEWEIPAPNYKLLDSEFDIFDTSALMIIVSFDKKEFFRCSYLLGHFYESEQNKENEPENVDWTDIKRKINLEKPIIKMNDIDWN